MKNFISKLSHMGIIEVSGADAASFLQAQFTSNISLLATEQAQYSAWCNPQGRVIANFLIIRDNERYLLLLPVDLVNKICQRLKMYVLRSKVIVTDRTGEISCIGVHGDECLYNIEKLTDRVLLDTTVVSRIADRIFLLDTAEITTSLVVALSDSGCAFSDIESWHLLDMKNGVAWIVNATSEQVLPQELNLELIGGLSYNKGCYPGQEIVARLHFRGQLKRGLFAGHIESSESTPAPGSRLSTGPDTSSSGIIINSARDTDNTVYILAVVNIDDVGTKTVFTDSGEPLNLQSLPYANPAET